MPLADSASLSLSLFFPSISVMASGPCDSDSSTDGNIFCLGVARAVGGLHQRSKAILGISETWCDRGKPRSPMVEFPQWDIVTGPSDRVKRK